MKEHHGDCENGNPDAAKELTGRQKLFVLEYLKDPNGTRAAIHAGYSAKTAGPAASRLLKNVNVAAEIRKLRYARRKITASGRRRVRRLSQSLSCIDLADDWIILPPRVYNTRGLHEHNDGGRGDLFQHYALRVTFNGSSNELENLVPVREKFRFEAPISTVALF